MSLSFFSPFLWYLILIFCLVFVASTIIFHTLLQWLLIKKQLVLKGESLFLQGNEARKVCKKRLWDIPPFILNHSLSNILDHVAASYHETSFQFFTLIDPRKFRNLELEGVYGRSPEGLSFCFPTSGDLYGTFSKAWRVPSMSNKFCKNNFYF